MLLPILIFQPDVKKSLYNPDELDNTQKLSRWIGNFIRTTVPTQLLLVSVTATTVAMINYLMRRLPSKLNEILNKEYCYVFASYKQKHEVFFQQMDRADREALLQEIKSDYRDILINYFTRETTLKEKIDKFINVVFCANIPVPQIIEIHMELIEEFSKQLRLEGRSDEALLDYRLTLIDILAHLCEIYRCSIYK
ncbi:MAG: circadian clock protein KaiA [Mojavia pulchra JT2-VF2]|uniref:Circadian clock oscillator protein KaiA n=1 Tax=Mojavia pulchra JT2-VF2 TaxID=287848 RepID=A0A951UFY2_9NOST|nr:circadian clock protein KaiA [Mojavia pulchra JT2-VF2]